MNNKNQKDKNEKIILIDDPLSTKDITLLEEILNKANGNKYLNAVQYGSLGGNFGIFTDSDKEPLNKYLPGGIVIRGRYNIQEIKSRYDNIKKRA